jgi:hypothetical protein
MKPQTTNKKIQRYLALTSLCAGIFAAMPSAHAANWIMLQGTEPAGTAPRAEVWGFIQPTYSKDFSNAFAGKYVPPKRPQPGFAVLFQHPACTNRRAGHRFPAG